MSKRRIFVIVLMVGLLLLVLLPQIGLGQVTAPSGGTETGINNTVGVGADDTGTGINNTRDFSSYLDNLYLWFLSVVGIAALLSIVVGGVMYMFAGANITSTGQARQRITNALWGILLAAASVLLLMTINPDLVPGFNINNVVNKLINDSSTNLPQPCPGNQKADPSGKCPDIP